MKFELNDYEQKLAKQFIEMCILIEKYQTECVETERKLTFTYLFSNSSGIGQASSIECVQLQIGISLTDYSAW